jgi:hypothetical protein
MCNQPAVVDALDDRVIYIGETCDQTLEKRWYQFNRSGFEQKAGHSGGWTFASQYCNNQINMPCPWLYVAALPVLTEEPHRSAYIRMIERRLIWEHVQRFGHVVTASEWRSAAIMKTLRPSAPL